MRYLGPTSALRRSSATALVLALGLLVSGCSPSKKTQARVELESLQACEIAVKEGLRSIAPSRDRRFEGKVTEATAKCRGGENAVRHRETPWTDWQNYWATGDASSKASELVEHAPRLGPNEHGIDGALLDLEYERIELIKFNLFDNNKTYEAFVTGRKGVPGAALKVWPEMRLPPGHPDYVRVGGAGDQLCRGELIRHRTLSGICNDIRNPLMGSTGQLFARNVEFSATFPELQLNELARNRHGDRLGLLKPDPQVISRVLFTRTQSAPARCNNGYGLKDNSPEANCDYEKASFFNVLAAFWIQFMTHDWFTHLEEGHNAEQFMTVGCSDADASAFGCRPADRIDRSYVAEDGKPQAFTHQGVRYDSRAPRTFRNNTTAWWDASQIYGYDERSLRRVKHDASDSAKLLMVRLPGRSSQGDGQGYLPLLSADDPINPEWAGQEATGFPDNWTVGMSFYSNLFAREHNLFVDEFRRQAGQTPDGDCGLRNPDAPERVIRYRDVSAHELFEVARLVVAAEIAKIHTTEWTTQLLYDEPLYRGMNGNWSGLFGTDSGVSAALGQIVSRNFGRSDSVKNATQWYSVFASGAGIIGLGSKVYAEDPVFAALNPGRKDIWRMDNPDHVNGGVNHFGSPFNFPEEFVSVYRLHPLVPDLIEYRELTGDPNRIRSKIPLVETFRGKATDAMRSRGLSNWVLSFGRQRLGALTLHNHPRFLQNLTMNRLQSDTHQIDVAALDLIRDRERGVPRYNEFRRQYGLRTLGSFDELVDQHFPAGSAERQQQEELVRSLRQLYGQHICDASKVITDAQRNAQGSPIDDCLGHPNRTKVDNIEDVDTIVGYLAESTRPHGFAISETQFVVFILNASRRLFSDRFLTSSFRPEFYTQLGIDWVNHNGPGPQLIEHGRPNGHEQPVSPMKRLLLRTMPELAGELEDVVNAFDPWARDRGEYYSLAWKPRHGAESDESFQSR